MSLSADDRDWLVRALAYHLYLALLHAHGPVAAQAYAEEVGLVAPGDIVAIDAEIRPTR